MEKETATELEIPGECQYAGEPAVVRPSQPTPRHTLYLANLDDQRFLRFSIKYLYVFTAPAAVSAHALRAALSRVLVDYYPLAGRLRPSDDDEGKLVVDCNAEGALFAEGALPGLTAAEFLRGRARPHKSWRKLLYRVEAQNFVAIPPLVVQVTRLGCGGIILCTAINHCICDGVGSAQFLHAWARTARAAGHDAAAADAAPFHDRRALRPRCPARVAFTHPEYSSASASANGNDASGSLLARLLSQPLAPVSLTFTAAHLLRLKRQCAPSLKCTSFEALAAHVWRAWVRALDPPGALRVKLLFSVNVRRRVKPELPRGYYGNGFVLGCAESTAAQLTSSSPSNARYRVRLVQEAKECVDDEYVRSMVDLLEERRGAKPDLAASLVISAWTRLGLEDLDFGAGAPAHMGPLTSEIYCVFLPVVGDPHGVTVLVSVPQAAADRFQHCCLGFLKDTDVDAKLS